MLGISINRSMQQISKGEIAPLPMDIERTYPAISSLRNHCLVKDKRKPVSELLKEIESVNVEDEPEQDEQHKDVEGINEFTQSNITQGKSLGEGNFGISST